jgi:hypothetical protein
MQASAPRGIHRWPTPMRCALPRLPATRGAAREAAPPRKGMPHTASIPTLLPHSFAGRSCTEGWCSICTYRLLVHLPLGTELRGHIHVLCCFNWGEESWDIAGARELATHTAATQLTATTRNSSRQLATHCGHSQPTVATHNSLRQQHYKRLGVRGTSF